MYNLITILGPTASGKTILAVKIAEKQTGEIISADSRQVYLGLDIGSGKDLLEYQTPTGAIPYHLIDIKPVSYEYNLFEFQQDAYKIIQAIWSRQNLPIVCGGTGMYLQALLQHYDLRPVPESKIFRKTLENLSTEKLIEMLSQYISLHNQTDTEDRDRLVRALEIAKYKAENKLDEHPALSPLIIGLHFPRDLLKERITQRLNTRLDQGMISEVENLLQSGVSAERLKMLGLEYRFITQYLQSEIKRYNDFYQKLNSAIHQFAKRQMTWFRKMEKDGIIIHWIDGELPLSKKLDQLNHLLINK